MRSEFMISMSCDSVWRGLEQSLIDDEVDQWQTRLRAYVRASGGHFERTLWLSICFLCTLCFTPCLMQHVIFKECIIKVWNVMFSFLTREHKYVIYVRWTFLSYMCKIILPAYNSAEIIKIVKSIMIFQSYDHKCTATFLWFTVYIVSHKKTPKLFW